jgi:hypothetical protein
METFISSKVAREFVSALQSVVSDKISKGQKINLFGIVQIVPRYHTAGTREVYKIFGDPDSGRVKKRYKGKVTLAVKALKGLKDSMPTVNRVQKAAGR